MGGEDRLGDSDFVRDSGPGKQSGFLYVCISLAYQKVGANDYGDE